MKKQLSVLSFFLLIIFAASSVQADAVSSEEIVEVPSEVATPAAKSSSVETENAADPEDSGWEFDVTPFPAWVPDASGDFGVGNVAIPYDLDHGDIVDLVKDDLDWAVTGSFEARNDGLILGVDLIASKLSGVSLGDVNFNDDIIDVDMDITTVMLDLTIGYRFYDGPLGNESYPRITVDGLAMASHFRLEQKTQISAVPLPILNGLIGQTVVDEHLYFWEPLIGGRVNLQFDEKWSLNSKVLLGGGGYWDSRGSNDGQAHVLLGYRMSERWTVLAGARWLDFEYKKDDIEVFSMEDSWGPLLAFKASF